MGPGSHHHQQSLFPQLISTLYTRHPYTSAHVFICTKYPVPVDTQYQLHTYDTQILSKPTPIISPLHRYVHILSVSVHHTAASVHITRTQTSWYRNVLSRAIFRVSQYTSCIMGTYIHIHRMAMIAMIANHYLRNYIPFTATIINTDPLL